MEQRIEKLEIDVAAIKVDVATILSNYVSRTDIADLRRDMPKPTITLHKRITATLIGLFIGFGGLYFIISRPAGPTVPVPITYSAPIIIAIALPAPSPVAPGK